VARDDIAAAKREKRDGFGVRVNREVPLEQLEHVAVAKFAKSAIQYDSLEEAFPAADPGLITFGSDVLVQIRTPKKRTKGGLYLPEESRETDLWNMQVAKVIAIGPVAFRNRETMKPWSECRVSLWTKLGYWLRLKKAPSINPWCKPGEYVRVPKYGGDRWWADVPDAEDGKALFVLFDDLVMKGRIPDDKVLDMVAYI
jgi:Chaperonin 10 Kd subunit